MGMLINVYRTAGHDCTNGPSRIHDRLCVINVDGPFEPSADAPAFILEPGAMPGIARLVPAYEGDKPWFMFGGNYGATSDSRFNRAVEQIIGGRTARTDWTYSFYGAVAIHDRVE